VRLKPGLHLSDFTLLGVDDLFAKLNNRRAGQFGLLGIRIAPEWCGIMVWMSSASPIGTIV
jgi:hypothetical protein